MYIYCYIHLVFLFLFVINITFLFIQKYAQNAAEVWTLWIGALWMQDSFMSSKNSSILVT